MALAAGLHSVEIARRPSSANGVDFWTVVINRPHEGDAGLVHAAMQLAISTIEGTRAERTIEDFRLQNGYEQWCKKLAPAFSD